MMQEVRILIADDQAAIRFAVRRILNAHPRFKVVGEATDGIAAIEQTEAIRPHVVVLNITMPRKNGLEAAREIRNVAPNTAVIILSTHADEQFIREARTCGASAYINKSDAGIKLVQAVESAAADSTVDDRIIE